MVIRGEVVPVVVVVVVVVVIVDEFTFTLAAELFAMVP